MDVEIFTEEFLVELKGLCRQYEENLAEEWDIDSKSLENCRRKVVAEGSIELIKSSIRILEESNGKMFAKINEAERVRNNNQDENRRGVDGHNRRCCKKVSCAECNPFY
jgi:hypothetical protein